MMFLRSVVLFYLVEQVIFVLFRLDVNVFFWGGGSCPENVFKPYYIFDRYGLKVQVIICFCAFKCCLRIISP